MQDNRKKLILTALIVLLLFVAIALLGYFVSSRQNPPDTSTNIKFDLPATSVNEEEGEIPTPDPQMSINWEKYESLKGGYEFKFPPNWNVETKPDSFEVLFGPDTTPTIGLGGVELHKSKQTIEEYADALNEGVYTVIEREQRNLGNVEGLYLKYQSGAIKGYSFVTKNSDLNLINVVYINSWKLADVANFNQLLSTYKLLTP